MGVTAPGWAACTGLIKTVQEHLNGGYPPRLLPQAEGPGLREFPEGNNPRVWRTPKPYRVPTEFLGRNVTPIARCYGQARVEPRTFHGTVYAQPVPQYTENITKRERRTQGGLVQRNVIYGAPKGRC